MATLQPVAALGAIEAPVMSAVIQKVSGMTAGQFAEKRLFEPLGISGVIWPSDKNGVSWGGGKIMSSRRL